MAWPAQPLVTAELDKGLSLPELEQSSTTGVLYITCLQPREDSVP